MRVGQTLFIRLVANQRAAVLQHAVRHTIGAPRLRNPINHALTTDIAEVRLQACDEDVAFCSLADV